MMSSEFGAAKADLLLGIRRIQARLGRVREMLETARPAVDILVALCRVREELQAFDVSVVRARLRRLRDEAGNGGGLQGGMAEPLQILGQAYRAYCPRRRRSQAPEAKVRHASSAKTAEASARGGAVERQHA